jgi:aryl-alcohol dehydrogenase-like predicted oxidoreductase
MVRLATADVYMAGVPGRVGDESETIIGRRLAKRGRRDKVMIATKVGLWDKRSGLGADNVRAAAEDSLRRLGTDYIDLYYAHRDDESRPLEETLRAFDALVRGGKVRYIGASNYGGPRLRQALQTSQREGLARYVALQTQYNLMERDYESQLAGVAAEHKLAVLTYFALAMGFLTSMAAVALAWLRVQPTVSVPIASARNTEQLTGLGQAATLELSQEQVSALTEASNPAR